MQVLPNHCVPVNFQAGSRCSGQPVLRNGTVHVQPCHQGGCKGKGIRGCRWLACCGPNCATDSKVLQLAFPQHPTAWLLVSDLHVKHSWLVHAAACRRNQCGTARGACVGVLFFLPRVVAYAVRACKVLDAVASNGLLHPRDSNSTRYLTGASTTVCTSQHCPMQRVLRPASLASPLPASAPA